MEFVGFGLFFLVWLVFVVGSFGGMVCAVAALISISRTNADAFGPWWDNTKTPWLLGVALGFVIPFGTLITGICWFWKGRAPLATTGLAARPFWIGPPKPPPYQSPWGYAPQAPYPPQAPHPPQPYPPQAPYPPQPYPPQAPYPPQPYPQYQPPQEPQPPYPGGPAPGPPSQP